MLIDNWVSVSYPEISRLIYEFATKKTEIVHTVIWHVR